MTSSFSKVQLTALFVAGLSLAAGCDKTSTPVAPDRDLALGLVLSNLNSVQSSLLGSIQNEVLLHLEGTGAPSGHWTVGPFAASASTGAVTLTVKIPSNPGTQVLSLQLNDAATHQPLALGAVAFDFAKGPPGRLVVDLGSVRRQCYFTDLSLNPGINNFSQAGSSYTFATDILIPGPGVALNGPDIGLVPSGSQFFIEEAFNAAPTANVIAYLGNGEMVDFGRVPPASQFFPFSYQSKAAAGMAVTNLQTGDIYCVKGNSLKGGYAWVQVTDPGVPGTTGPSFRFRANTTLPYYAYEVTTADGNSACGAGW